MTRRIGSGYIGTEEIKASTANQEMVPDPPENWTIGYSFYKFSFINFAPCHVKINGGSPIFLDSEQGFDSSEIDAPIRSFVIVEEGVPYQFIACY